MSPKTQCSVLEKWRTSPGSRCSISQRAPSVVVVSQCAQRGQQASRLVRSSSSWDFAKTCSLQLTDFSLAKVAETLQPSFLQLLTQTFSGRAQHVVRVWNSAQLTLNTLTQLLTCVVTKYSWNLVSQQKPDYFFATWKTRVTRGVLVLLSAPTGWLNSTSKFQSSMVQFLQRLNTSTGLDVPDRSTSAVASKLFQPHECCTVLA